MKNRRLSMFRRILLVSYVIVLVMASSSSSSIFVSSKEVDNNEETNTNIITDESNTNTNTNKNTNNKKKRDYFETTAEINEYDDRTLLDTFGQVAKEYLTQRLIPKTDKECRWDWRFVRCEPYCQCDFLFKPGDYHLGRSCRKREEELESCSNSGNNNNNIGDGDRGGDGSSIDDNDIIPTSDLQLAIQRIVQGTQKTVSIVKGKTKLTYLKVQSKVCDPLPENMTCPPPLSSSSSDDDDADGAATTADTGSNNADSEIPLFAWQERVLCRHKIPDCLLEQQDRYLNKKKKQAAASAEGQQQQGHFD